MLLLPPSPSLPSILPSTLPRAGQLLRLFHIDIHPLLSQHQPHPCPRLPRTAFEGQKSQNSFCSQHPPSPLNCRQRRGGAESPVLGVGWGGGGWGRTERKESLLRSGDAKQQHGNSPIWIEEAICRDTQHKPRLSSEHHKRETLPSAIS